MEESKKKAELSRRSFLTGTGILAATGALGLGLSACSSEEAAGANGEKVTVNYPDTIDWQAEYDVVVIGWGGAGSATAITAADEGAKVLLLEKAPYGDEGGNTRYCEQYAYTPVTSVEDGAEVLGIFAEGFDTATPEILNYMAQGSMDNKEWILSMGAENFEPPTSRSDGAAGDAEPVFPDIGEMGEYATMVDGQPKLVGEWGILPNGELNGGRIVAHQVNAPDNGRKQYWKLMRKNVVDRSDKITVWFESPATKLIQEPFSKTIIGVQAEREGATVNIRAKNGVVLTCGSYEANPDMLETFAQVAYGLPLGSTYNTGDGIKMALDIGADLWHMSALSGPWIAPKYEGENRGIFGGVMPQRITIDPGCIYVGGTAKRFMAESGWHKHGHINIGGSWENQTLPHKIWAIMSETARNGSGVIKVTPESSILKADTVEDLAAQLELDAETLSQTLNKWNEDVANGEDTLFHRPTVALGAVEPPYYAVELFSCFVNSQGGPRKNIECEILDKEGNPIPHLYSAGELGSFWAGVYAGGGNVAETMYTGRTAGKNAAEVKPELEPVELTIVEYSPQDIPNDLDKTESQVEVELGEGEYLGTGEGLRGPITVKVKLEGDKIVSVEVIDQKETPEVTSEVWEKLPSEIVAANGIDGVDVITGATRASDGLFEAVADALAQAQ